MKNGSEKHATTKNRGYIQKMLEKNRDGERKINSKNWLKMLK
jgi:hypothetical protein